MVGLRELISSTGGENDTHTQAMAFKHMLMWIGQAKLAPRRSHALFVGRWGTFLERQFPGGQTLWTCTRKRTTRPHEEAFPLAQLVFVQPP